MFFPVTVLSLVRLVLRTIDEASADHTFELSHILVRISLKTAPNTTTLPLFLSSALVTACLPFPSLLPPLWSMLSLT